MVANGTRRKLAQSCVAFAGLLISMVLLAGLATQAGASAGSVVRARAAAGPNLGPHQTPCDPRHSCCPGVDCFGHPELIPEAPYLVETAIGRETISPHAVRVGQRFTITFHSNVVDPKGWTFPDIAKKVSACRTGVDLKCTYLARAADVTFPGFATFNGWTDYTFTVGNSRGTGVGYDYYAIFGNKPAVSGRLADKHGKGIPRGGIQTAPGQPTPDPGVLIGFYVRRHGVLTAVAGAAPSLHTSSAHPYDVGYYGAALRPGTYIVLAGDPIEHVSCRQRTLHLTHSVTNFNFLCKRG